MDTAIGNYGASRFEVQRDGKRWAVAESIEDARLIAAAPRMFDALSAIAAMREGNAKEIAALAASVAAITLAEIADGA